MIVAFAIFAVATDVALFVRGYPREAVVFALLAMAAILLGVRRERRG